MSFRSRSRPAGLGGDFARLWAANAVSTLGDGITRAAGPLLTASITDNPALVAGAAFAQRLPWLLFALVSGVYVDRLDRRRLIALVDTLRGIVIGGLAVAVAVDAATVPVVYLAFFLLGTGETLANSASNALLPSIVPAADLGRANARMSLVHHVGNQFIAPPLGAWLFVVAAAIPFGVDAATFLVAAALVATLRHRPTPAPSFVAGSERRSVPAEIAEGVRWLWRHRALRMIAVCLCLMNINLSAAFSLLVLYSRDRLGLDEVGYGLLLTSIAVGGVVGASLSARLQTRFGPAPLLRIGLVVETLTHLALALASVSWLAAATLIVFGVHDAIWNVVTRTVRQLAIPTQLYGRVGSVFALFAIGGDAIGALYGGFAASTWGLTAPFWLGAGAMALVTSVAWRRFTPATLAAAPPPASSTDTDTGSDPATAGKG